LPGASDCSWPILLKKSVRPNNLVIDWLKRLFCTLLREIRVRKPLPKVKISISDAYFSAAQTMVDFFNRIGRSLPFMVATRAGQIRCRTVEKQKMAFIYELTRVA
jgi:hypothetical protein